MEQYEMCNFVKHLKLGFDFEIKNITPSTIYTEGKKKILCYILTGFVQNKEENIVVQMKDFINFKNGK